MILSWLLQIVLLVRVLIVSSSLITTTILIVVDAQKTIRRRTSVPPPTRRTASSTAAAATLPSAVPRIVGGDKVSSPTKYPWFVSIRFNGSACGGSLIAPRVVLTAAHCLTLTDSSRNDTVVLVGEDAYHRTATTTPTQQYHCIEQAIHPNYTSVHSNPNIKLPFVNE